jgi:tetratricopeptide (TPR) repeat protein
LLDSESSPFADIQAFSTFPDEQEVLLSMGITLQVQSVTSSLQKKNMYIQARLYYEEDAAMKELKAYILKKELHHGQDESYYMDSLGSFLLWMGDHEKLQQFIKLLKPGTENTVNKILRFSSQYASFVRCPTDVIESGIQHRVILDSFLSLVKIFQDLADHPRVSNCLREQFLSITKYLTSCSLGQNLDEIIKDPIQMVNQLISLSSSFEKIISLLSIPLSHPCVSLFPLIRGIGENFQGNHAEALKHFETSCASSSASFLSENNPLRQAAMISMASSVAALPDDNRLLRILEDLHTSGKPQVGTLVELAKLHERIEDLPMAIAYYRAVIEDCDLPPNSIAIVDAYHAIGSAFRKLNDIESALSNLYRARELLLQHHPPTHPLSTNLSTTILIMESMQGLQEILKLLPN